MYVKVTQYVTETKEWKHVYIKYVYIDIILKVIINFL